MKNLTNKNYVLIIIKLLVITKHISSHSQKKESYNIISKGLGVIYKFENAEFISVNNRLVKTISVP